MSQRLWTPLHGWLGKLGLCKPSRPSKIQCGKLKSPVSLCSGLSQLDREEGEWRSFSFTTWRFLKCHNQLSPPHTHTSPPIPLFNSFYLFAPFVCCSRSPQSYISFPLFLCQVLHSILIVLTHEAPIYYVFEKPDPTDWQAEGKQQSQRRPEKRNKPGY